MRASHFLRGVKGHRVDTVFSALMLIVCGACVGYACAVSDERNIARLERKAKAERMAREADEFKRYLGGV